MLPSNHNLNTLPSSRFINPLASKIKCSCEFAMVLPTTLGDIRRRGWIQTASFLLFVRSLRVGYRAKLFLSALATHYFWFLPIGATQVPWLYALLVFVASCGLIWWQHGIGPFVEPDNAVSLAGVAVWIVIITIGHSCADSLVGRLWLVRFPVGLFPEASNEGRHLSPPNIKLSARLLV
jgi:hypothetical protein